jgi:hypothetical protein
VHWSSPLVIFTSYLNSICPYQAATCNTLGSPLLTPTLPPTVSGSLLLCQAPNPVAMAVLSCGLRRSTPCRDPGLSGPATELTLLVLVLVWKWSSHSHLGTSTRNFSLLASWRVSLLWSWASRKQLLCFPGGHHAHVRLWAILAFEGKAETRRACWVL